MEGQSVISSKLRFIESKRKLKLSSQDVTDAAGCKLITAANNHALIIFGSQEDNSIKAIPFDQLMEFNQSHSKSELLNFNQYKFVISLSFKPNILTVARYGYSSILLVVGENAFEAFDLDTQHSIGRAQLNSAGIIDYAWHPSIDSIVALCTKSGELVVIYINRKDRNVGLVYHSQQYGALTCCWSPKGKNLAIGMADGRVRRLEPVFSGPSFTFKDLDKSIITFSNPKITPQHRLVKLRWINKTHLIGVHTKPPNPAGPDTVFSMFTVKPTAPYKYWTSICFESQIVSEQNYYVANLTDAVVCGSNASGEAAVLGLDGEEWKTIIIDEEGARIELPLDSSNTETFPRGLTVACLNKQPVIVFYTSAGVVCAYATSDPSYQLPTLPELISMTPPHQPLAALPQQAPTNQPQQQLSDLSKQLSTMLPQQQLSDLSKQLSTMLPQQQPASLPRQASTTVPQRPATILSQQPTTISPQQPTATLPQQPSTTSPQQPTKVLPQQPSKASMVKISREMHAIAQEIASIKVVDACVPGVHLICRDLDSIKEIHTMHREAIAAISKDVESLDAGMLENLYLIEYIKTHSKKQTKKRYLDPATQSKVESIRSKVEAISHKLRDVNSHVDIEWSLYNNKKNNKLDSLEMIYKTLATQQKIISTLKKKASILMPAKNFPSSNDESFHHSINESVVPTKEINPARLNAFREFLASRDTVPVRRPE